MSEGLGPRTRAKLRALPVWNIAPTRWLQCFACAVLAFGWVRGSADLNDQRSEQMRQSEDVFAEAHGIRPQSREAMLGLSTIDVIVGRNDTLERIFRRLELSLSDLASLRSLPDLRAQLDRLRLGELIKFNLRGSELFGLERKLSASDTLKVEREQSGFATGVVVNPLEHEVRTTRGSIQNSLFKAADEAGLSDATAMQLAEIFAWDIDFVLDIQSGDSFVVTHDAVSQDGEYVSDGDILAVEFVNGGKTHRAVRYTDPNGITAYYTPEGKSLRKAFLRAPLQFSRVSSRFNMYRKHPVLNRIRAHKGVDYAAPIGTPVRAAGDARVRYVGQQGGYGKVVELEHRAGIVTVYGHLSRFAQRLSRGDRVSQSDVIGYVGMTGLATGPHLHYEYRVGGIQKNPQTVALPTAEPVPEQWIADFRARSSPWLASLGKPAQSAGPVGTLAR